MRAQMHGEVHLDTPPTTPTALSSSAHHLFAEANSIHERLHKVSSLAPGDQVNTLLSRLVSLCIPPYDPELVTYFNKIDGIDTLRTSLRTLCSTAEGELEAHWALRILHQCSSVTGMRAHSPTRKQVNACRRLIARAGTPGAVSLLPQLPRSDTPRSITPPRLASYLHSTAPHRIHWLGALAVDFLLPRRRIPGRRRAQHRPRRRRPCHIAGACQRSRLRATNDLRMRRRQCWFSCASRRDRLVCI